MPTIKVAAIGSRGFASLGEVPIVLDSMKKTIEAANNVMEVVSGGCEGVDKKVEEWCRINGVPITVVKAEDEDQGKKRNGKLLEGVVAFVAFWDGTSENTLDAIVRAHKSKSINTRVYVR